MATKTHTSKKSASVTQNNTIETLKNLGSRAVRDAASDVAKIGGGILDSLSGNYDYGDYEDDPYMSEYEKREESHKPQRKEFTLFHYNEYHEKVLIRKQIQELTEQIKSEIESVKKAEKSLLDEVKDIDKLSVEQLPEKPGVYHVRFLEIILTILRTLRSKISESKSWLEAMTTRRKKRGSLFAVLSKKKGTQYSLSQELQSARSVQ